MFDVVCPHQRISLVVLPVWLTALAASAQVTVPVVSETNVTFRIMAANTTSGSNQRYEAPGIRIFQGLRPDIVALQEFNYASTSNLGVNTPAALREFVDVAFGTNFSFFRESGTGYTIPNGIVSRYPILASGSWVDVDPGVNDRGFAWAKIGIPGTNDLYVVSVHFKASSGSDNVLRRATQATNLLNLIQASFPASAWVVLGGDLNIHDSNEAALVHLQTFFSDAVVPTDTVTGGDPDTNLGRTERYDYVLAAPRLAALQTPSKLPGREFSRGLVFDSRVYSTLYGLGDVPPVQAGDSGVSGMQHMGVIKDFTITYAVTNWMPVPTPELELVSSNRFSWIGLSNLAYRVESTTNLAGTDWSTEAVAAVNGTNFTHTFDHSGAPVRLYRVVYP